MNLWCDWEMHAFGFKCDTLNKKIPAKCFYLMSFRGDECQLSGNLGEWLHGFPLPSFALNLDLKHLFLGLEYFHLDIPLWLKQPKIGEKGDWSALSLKHLKRGSIQTQKMVLKSLLCFLEFLGQLTGIKFQTAARMLSNSNEWQPFWDLQLGCGDYKCKQGGPGTLGRESLY